jgi:hypothetical protein
MEIGPLYLSLERRNSGHSQVTEETSSIASQSRQGSYGLNWYVIPGTVAGIAGGIINGNRFSLEHTLRYGTPIFYENNISQEEKGSRYGFLGSNALLLNENITNGETRHELIHVNQIASYRNLGSLLPNEYLNINNSLRRHHIDINTVPGDILENLQNILLPYGNSLGEWEARILSGYPPRF